MRKKPKKIKKTSKKAADRKRPAAASPDRATRMVSDFWKRHTLESLAGEQGVPAITPIEKFAGIWPKDQLDDGFELELRRWRSQGRGRRR